MRVTFVIQSGRYGGATQMLYWVASALQNNGNIVEVLALENCDDIEKHRKGWSFSALNCKMSKNIIKRNSIDIFSALGKLISHLKYSRPEVIVSFGDHSFYPSWIVSRIMKIKLVISERVDPYSCRKTSEKIRRFCYRLTDGAVFQTKKAMEYFPRKLQEKSTVIYNPVKYTEKVIPWDSTKCNNSIIYIGRIDNFQKRIDLLIDAFEIVHNQYPEYSLEIYGDGPDEEILKMKKMINIKGKDIESSIHYHGKASNVYYVLTTGKIFVLTSDFEGIPNSVIEAMQAGIPVVATDCSPGGARLLLANNQYGRLVNRGDTNSIAEGIIWTLDNFSTACKKADDAKRALDRFDERKIALQWVEFIKKVGERHES